MRSQTTILLAASFLAMAASPAFATAAVPGPVAGAGLGYLAIAGGYYLVRRWRNR